MSTRRSEQYPDYFDKLADLVGATSGELRRAIVDASMRDWLRTLRRVLKEQQELPDVDVDLWDPEERG